MQHHGFFRNLPYFNMSLVNIPWKVSSYRKWKHSFAHAVWYSCLQGSKPNFVQCHYLATESHSMVTRSKILVARKNWENWILQEFEQHHIFHTHFFVRFLSALYPQFKYMTFIYSLPSIHHFTGLFRTTIMTSSQLAC